MGGCVSAPRAVKYDQEPPEELPKAEETTTIATMAMAGKMNDVEKEEHGEGLVMSRSLEDSLDKARVFLAVQTEADIISAIKMEADAERIPKSIAQAMEELYYNYKNAVLQSGLPNADKFVLSVMKVVLDRIINDVEEPFAFPPYHKSIREPFDYYSFVLNYFRPLIDFKTSYVGNISLFHEIEQKLQKGENIILASNHQTEADPAIVELLLEKVLPNLGKKMICVAGDRVITDPLCKPFSKGRNLLCVYSKKHINDVPELVEMKKRANKESLKEMGMLLKEGSKIIWIAPSGGRDRPDPVTKELSPAHFDVSAVENMRRLIEHVGVIGHIYPLAMLCYDIMPPPSQVEKEIGEKREINFYGAGLSVCPEINFHEISAEFTDPEEAKKAYTHALYNSVKEQYGVLKRAVHGKEGLETSVQSVSLSQPWF